MNESFTGKQLKVCEIFASIQGESTLQGLPCVFVRLSGCNLNCAYCDSIYAKDEGELLLLDEIIKRISSFSIPYVCITGGEPLLQEETISLSKILVNSNIRVSIETNGTIDTTMLPSQVKRIIDIKCPGSGESGKTHSANLKNINAQDEFKFVLTDRNDFEYTVSFVKKYNLLNYSEVLLSPVADKLSYSNLAEWIIKELPEARLNIQLHKIIWPGESRCR